MSRTDAHTPFRVRLHRGEIAARAEHAVDHPVCDLPSSPPLTDAQWRQSRCHWKLQYTGTNVCSCFICHAGVEARRANRRARQDDRRQLRESLKAWRGGADSGFDEAFSPVARRGFW